MKKNLIYLLLTLGLGLFATSCSKSVDENNASMKTSTQIKLDDVFYALPGYELTKATLELNGTPSTVLTTPFECRNFSYFKNANGVVEYKLNLTLTNLSSEDIDYKNIAAHGKMLASQLNNDCNVIVFYQDGNQYKIKINGADPIEP